ncbi:bifunctional diaminohydroxyphosphoribosylaminopyrimidine deaminase/5-amino-6-(5-phosphoribosylamino)uracil reductase [Frateuria sp. Soil773]|uniref:bifunctional diaminohydroxyphosphoribosylaminopyrimidine deaminase/5-amino-6-(5-phosphoribosylamino)uracil reductase RibD n=1 Tax=Frateuria sp. Soil773 TaxID=1736407 RepID=UPI0006F50A80|nr:bifunctional diaminohydroxyphosphoribosylaminopyrimidine deaminase/5-amino-6-(5-phosphoribosylamino)uracil reductase RibD [Frateuria sp. Soil773]KRE88882.1 bifunctional diaminohydroxyphosphoribosylaminopyrimidine deaminase/5-amino-6-(5-phosphoribosylamino)uracil reductase [Frateuria sp. Soil773]
MAHALRLAERGLYTTRPNPRVGCVIAHGERVVGAGFHRRAGGPHAEVFALREAGAAARGATAYVTLEPCAHHGRTPPCADALVAAGVARVVVAAEDPFPQVAGRGIGRLRAAGIAVDAGLLREAARELNVGFFSRIERGRPWVRLKLAMSLDGRTALADGASKWITGEAARADVQRWRARSSAILTGIGTVLADDPRLTVRLPQDVPFEAPLRVVLDSRLRTPAGAALFDDGSPVLLIGLPGVRGDAREALAARGAVFGEAPAGADGRPDLAAVLAQLAAREVGELHVEAGPRLCGELFAQGLADELLLYVAPVLLGSAARPLLELPPLADMAARWRLHVVDRRQLGEDTRLLLRPR